ncbi:uncharacterized protein LOC113344424 [Papaver somniferum]|uniref:uncharacterized protein LOC113344424 n=1 Tax=Papaver somniferum TaxID=3469 RepID=UPI000E6F9071|nr:uncharacterized protein LOC113344424 [Papaver somniferum]
MPGTDDEEVDPPFKTLREYMYPTRVSQPLCIVLTSTKAHFEIRTSTIQALPNFYGRENENRYYHIRDFEELCGTVKIKDLTDEYLRLRLFPFSLKDKEKSWLDALPSSSIHTWDAMKKLFLHKFFPRHKTTSLRQSLNSFSQQEGESLYDYLERFHDILLQCPHHGFDSVRLTMILYEGLDHKTMTMVELLCGGNFQEKKTDEGYRFLHEIAEKTQEWDAKEPIRKSVPNKSGVHIVDIKFDSDANIAVMARRIESLEQNQFSSRPFVDHPFDDNVREQANALYQDNHQRFDPYLNTYNPGWSRHPNFSWSKGQYQDQPNSSMSSGFAQKDPSLTESLKLLTQNTLQLSQDMRQFAQFQQNASEFQQTTQRSIKNLEHQLGKLSI